MPVIVVRDGPFAGNRVEVGEAETVLGRASDDFLSHDEEVSRRHAAFRSTPGGLQVEDLGSANGTFVNERRIDAPTPLSSGDVVRLGRTELEVEIVATEPATVVGEAGPPAFAPLPSAAQSPPMTPPAAQQDPGMPSAGAYGIGLAVALVALLAALLGVIWGIAVLVFIIGGEPDSSAAWIVEIADLITTMVAVALAVAGGITLLRGQRSGRLLVVLGGAAGVVGPAINAVYYLPGSETINVLGWIGVAAMILYATVLILALVAGSRLTRGH